VFRQVVAHRWLPGTDAAARAGFRTAMESLRAIPELVALRHGDQGQFFAGNHDYVAVTDFPAGTRSASSARFDVAPLRPAAAHTTAPAGCRRARPTAPPIAPGCSRPTTGRGGIGTHRSVCRPHAAGLTLPAGCCRAPCYLAP
jgi:hypothetical protein